MHSESPSKKNRMGPSMEKDLPWESPCKIAKYYYTFIYSYIPVTGVLKNLYVTWQDSCEIYIEDDCMGFCT